MKDLVITASISYYDIVFMAYISIIPYNPSPKTCDSILRYKRLGNKPCFIFFTWPIAGVVNGLAIVFFFWPILKAVRERLWVARGLPQKV